MAPSAPWVASPQRQVVRLILQHQMEKALFRVKNGKRQIGERRGVSPQVKARHRRADAEPLAKSRRYFRHRGPQVEESSSPFSVPLPELNDEISRPRRWSSDT